MQEDGPCKPRVLYGSSELLQNGIYVNAGIDACPCEYLIVRRGTLVYHYDSWVLVDVEQRLSLQYSAGRCPREGHLYSFI